MANRLRNSAQNALHLSGSGSANHQGCSPFKVDDDEGGLAGCLVNPIQDRVLGYVGDDG